MEEADMKMLVDTLLAVCTTSHGPSNLVDGLFAIANSLDHVAQEIHGLADVVATAELRKFDDR